MITSTCYALLNQFECVLRLQGTKCAFQRAHKKKKSAICDQFQHAYLMCTVKNS